MDAAYCTFDNKVYDAVEFAKLPPGALEQRRRALLCNTCRYEAFFRSASSSGRGPCFGARPHGPNCVEATVDAGTWGRGGPEAEDPIFNAAGRIIIDLPPFENDDINDAVGGAAQKRRGVGRVFDAEGGISANSTRRRLSSLLRRLNQDPEFQFSEAAVKPPGGCEATTVKEFFVPFSKARERASRRFKGLWGLITDASYDNEGSLWLNTGNRNSISFVIAAEWAQKFMDRWAIHSPDELSGAQALVLGLARNSQYGKFFLPVEDIRFLVLDLA
ncbi:hypothetical protein CCAE64S_01528 [Castellaniella caeni]